MLTIFLFLLAPAFVSANDWNTPCLSGACGYDWAPNDNTPVSSIMITGSSSSISDITPAAGWQIMGCNPNWSSGPTDIRMVCAGTPEQMANCGHLFDNDGAEGTVVRLPQNCGTGPFARVAKTYVPDDQSVPANVTKLIKRAAGGNSTQPAVKGLTLDYSFGQQSPDQKGKVSFALASTNAAAKTVNKREMLRVLHARGRGKVIQRDFFGDLLGGVESVFNKATSAVGSEFNKATSVVGSDFNKATSAIASVATAAATAVVDAVNDAKQLTAINETGNLVSAPIQFTDNFPLIDATISCSANTKAGVVGGSATLHVDVGVDVNANVQFGYTFIGSIIPPSIDDAFISGSMKGDAAATFNIQAQAQGTFSTGNLALFKSGLPGLTVPGIVTLGPEFSLNGRLDMDVDLEAQMTVQADYVFPDVELKFPQDKGKSSADGATAKKDDNALKLSAQPNVAVTGTVEAHIIPRLDLGIDLGEGIAQASVFLELDLEGKLDMQVQAQASVTTTLGGGKNATTLEANSTLSDAGSNDNSTLADNGASDTQTSQGNDTAVDTSSANNTDAATKTESTDAKATNKPDAKGSAAANSTDTQDSKNNDTITDTATPTKTKRAMPLIALTPLPTPTPAPVALPRAAASGSANGCITLTGILSIDAGLQGTLQPIFNKAITFPIFTTQAQLFQKCFDTAPQAPKRRAQTLPAGSRAARYYRREATLNAAVRRAAAKPATAKQGGTKNDITPETSKSSTSSLSCGKSVSALGSLPVLI